MLPCGSHSSRRGSPPPRSTPSGGRVYHPRKCCCNLLQEVTELYLKRGVRPVHTPTNFMSASALPNRLRRNSGHGKSWDGQVPNPPWSGSSSSTGSRASLPNRATLSSWGWILKGATVTRLRRGDWLKQSSNSTHTRKSCVGEPRPKPLEQTNDRVAFVLTWRSSGFGK